MYLAAGSLGGALEAGERALAVFEERGNVWWACRALWALSPVANALGQWDRSLQYCRRALEHGTSLNDLRMKVVGWLRTGSTHVQRGDAEAGLACCEEAQRLGPIPFDAAMIRTVRGYGLVKAGHVDAGLTDLAEAVGWFERSGLRYTRSLVATWLVESRLRAGRREDLGVILQQVLQTAVADGYRHLEGIAQRLRGEWLLEEDRGAAVAHLDAAAAIFQEIGARNEEAKTLLARAELRRAAGDLLAVRELLEGARTIFDELGTRDEIRRAAALLEALPR